MSDAFRDMLGLLLLVAIALGPLALSRRARSDYRSAVRISLITALMLIPLIYVGTFLQTPPEAIEHPVRYLLFGHAYFLAIVIVANLTWRFFVMPRFKNNG